MSWVTRKQSYVTVMFSKRFTPLVYWPTILALCPFTLVCFMLLPFTNRLQSLDADCRVSIKSSHISFPCEHIVSHRNLTILSSIQSQFYQFRIVFHVPTHSLSFINLTSGFPETTNEVRTDLFQVTITFTASRATCLRIPSLPQIRWSESTFCHLRSVLEIDKANLDIGGRMTDVPKLSILKTNAAVLNSLHRRTAVSRMRRKGSQRGRHKKSCPAQNNKSLDVHDKLKKDADYLWLGSSPYTRKCSPHRGEGDYGQAERHESGMRPLSRTRGRSDQVSHKKMRNNQLLMKVKFSRLHMNACSSYCD